MKALSYYLALPFLWLISILPYPFIYLKSDFLFFLSYYVFRYRRKVVMQNLRNSFPGRTLNELKIIERKFYRHFCDVIMETIKLLSISRAQALKRCVLEEDSRKMVRRYFESKKSIVWIMGHTGNWEMAAASFAGLEGYRLNVLYRPLSNPWFDRLMLRIRSRFGSYPIAVDHTVRELLKCKDILTGTVFIGDQTPPPDSSYWTTFLNQDTPVYKGGEVIARKLEYVVIYAYIERVRRGFYRMRMQLITEDPAKLPENQLTEMHVRLLEKDILDKPWNWLWSHRRWKHKRQGT